VAVNENFYLCVHSLVEKLNINVKIHGEHNVKLMPVIIGATGIATKVLNKNLEAVPGIYSTDSLQTRVYLERHT
jgi:hypothetical protein